MTNIVPAYPRSEPQGERSGSATPSSNSQLIDPSTSTEGSSTDVCTAVTTPVTSLSSQYLRPVWQWTELWDLRKRGYDTADYWEKIRQEKAEHEAIRQDRMKLRKQDLNLLGVSLAPIDAFEIETNPPRVERYARCLEQFAGVAECENSHENPAKVPCRQAWCPRCRSIPLLLLRDLYLPTEDKNIIANRRALRSKIGSTATVITIYRRIGTSMDIIYDITLIERVRKTLDKATERLAGRTNPIMRGDRIRFDASGALYAERLVLLQGDAEIGRMSNAVVTLSGDAQKVAEAFVVLVGTNWSKQPVDELTARALFHQLAGKHRIETFRPFGTLLYDCLRAAECVECHAKVEIRMMSWQASPDVPVDQIEYRSALERDHLIARAKPPESP